MSTTLPATNIGTTAQAADGGLRVRFVDARTGRTIIGSDAPTVKHLAPKGTRLDSIGNQDVGSHDLRAHDLRRAAAKARANRKRIADALSAIRARGIDPRSTSRARARHIFDVAVDAQSHEYAATAAAAWLWIAGAGFERSHVRDYIVRALETASRAPDGIAFVRDFTRSLGQTVTDAKGKAIGGMCIDPALVSDLYAIAAERIALTRGYALPSQLVTNGKRVGGTANQRIWDARPAPQSSGRSKPIAPVVKVRSVPLSLSDSGTGGLISSGDSAAGASRSARVIEHAHNGDPTVTLGHADLDDACRIVRAVERSRDASVLATSRLRNDASVSAWHIAVCALKTDPSLARFASDVKRIGRRGGTNFIFGDCGHSAIATQKPSAAWQAHLEALASGAVERMQGFARSVPMVGTNRVSAHTGPVDVVAVDSARIDYPPTSLG